MNLNIYPVSYEYIAHLKSQLARERVIIADDGTEYYGIYNHIHLVGIVGSKKVAGSIRYKSDWIMPNFRGKGLYKMLFEFRDKQHLEQKFFTAFCTPMSLPVYKKYGFDVVSVSKTGITRVERIGGFNA